MKLYRRKCGVNIIFDRDGKNYDAADYAKIIEEMQEITLGVNSTFKIPIIYG